MSSVIPNYLDKALRQWRDEDTPEFLQEWIAENLSDAWLIDGGILLIDTEWNVQYSVSLEALMRETIRCFYERGDEDEDDEDKRRLLKTRQALVECIKILDGHINTPSPTQTRVPEASKDPG